MSEVSQAVVNYKRVCDKNGFCVVKIISQNNQTPISNTLIQKPEQKSEQNIEQKTNEKPEIPQKTTIKFSSSRKNKKK